MDKDTDQRNGSDLSLQSLLKQTPAALPALSVACLTLAILYNISYLYFANALEMATISANDVISRSWTILPVSIFFIFVNFLSYFSGYYLGFRNTRNKISHTNKFLNALQHAMFLFGIGISIGAPIAAVAARAAINDNVAALDLLVKCLYLMNFGSILIIFSGIWVNHAAIPKIAIVYLSAILLCGLSGYNGINALLSSQNSLVRYGQGHLFCGKSIVVLERGIILFEPTYQVRKFIPASEIKSIEKPAGCLLAHPFKRAGAK